MISNTASSKLEPPINVITENVICDDKLLVILTVPRGENKPYAANKTDYWVKVGADKRRATREELRCLMHASGSVYADEMSIPATSIDDIDMFFFKEFYAMKDIWGRVQNIHGILCERYLGTGTKYSQNIIFMV
jgi:ATP-dependent DNA helicase RecG